MTRTRSVGWCFGDGASRCLTAFPLLAVLVLTCLPDPAMGGSYLDSAHGDSDHGVNRSTIESWYAQYATGNCAHCHEMHASVEGGEPQPVGGAARSALYGESFNANRTLNPYLEEDSFCFSCHNDSTGSQVINQDYSGSFGGAAPGSGPQSVLAAFNQASYHNLHDISSFLASDARYASWFAKKGIPCSACHNPHLAKRNWDSSQAGFPLLSAITMPNTDDTLWGETEVMSGYFGYEAPYATDGSREPAGFGEPSGVNTPDYVSFCGACHNADTTLWSTSLNRNLVKVNWRHTGAGKDKHGSHPRDGTTHFREPYLSGAVTTGNFLLSCLDCHEPHGSANIMLLRRRINGGDLGGAVDSGDNLGFACGRCHTDDAAASGGTGQANRWEYVHHLVADAPYAQATCVDCHAGGDGTTPVPCGNCHGHGMDDSWAGTHQTGRKTF